jgi:hypothetical protein
LEASTVNILRVPEDEYSQNYFSNNARNVEFNARNVEFARPPGARNTTVS